MHLLTLFMDYIRLTTCNLQQIIYNPWYLLAAPVSVAFVFLSVCTPNNSEWLDQLWSGIESICEALSSMVSRNHFGFEFWLSLQQYITQHNISETSESTINSPLSPINHVSGSAVELGLRAEENRLGLWNQSRRSQRWRHFQPTLKATLFYQEHDIRKRHDGFPLPFAIPCIIQIMLNGQLLRRYTAFKIMWQAPCQFKNCVDQAKNFLDREINEHAPSYCAYEVSQQFRIYEAPGDKWFEPYGCSELISTLASGQNQEDASEDEDGAIENEVGTPIYAEDISIKEAWGQNVPRKLAPYLLDKLKTNFSLELRFSYRTYQPHIKTCSGSDCVPEIYDALMHQQVYVHKDKGGTEKWFVPTRFLDKYLDENLIRHLVEKYGWSKISGHVPAGHADDSEKESFIKDILLSGTHLLGTTICARLDLCYLYRLWKAGMRDEHMPISRDDTLTGSEPVCPDTKSRLATMYSQFQDNQRHFMAHIFPDSNDTKAKQHQPIDSCRIIPILHKKERGRGANAKVYAIRIHEDYHNFTPNRNEKMALKILNMTLDDESRNDECDVLRTLAEVPHDHLIPFYASWTYNQRYHMLFPLAKCDLYSYLKKTPAPSLASEKVLWLIAQMAGLAAAVNHIHYLGPAGLGPSGKTTDGITRPRICAHMDLSLKNVLLFKGDIMKISDFGTAKIREIVSGESVVGLHRNGGGNLEYAAPEHELTNESISRPYDIWSLGCIFLEILLWAFGKGPDLEAFRQERLISPQQPSGGRTAAFYYRNGTTFALKSTVEDRLHWLQEEALKQTLYKDVFKLLVAEVRKMLQIKRKMRSISGEVSNNLQHLLLQAKLESKNPQAASRPRYAPPSTIHREYGPWDEDSRVGDSPHQLLSPHPPTFRSLPRLRTSADGEINSPVPSPASSPTIPALTSSMVLHSGAGAVEGYGDQALLAVAPQLEVTRPDVDAIVEAQESQKSALLQDIQAQLRPGLQQDSDSGQPPVSP